MISDRKKTRCIGFLLALLYVGFFVSGHFFVHSHQAIGHVVVHSHPFASHHHSHSQNQFETIDQLSYDTCLPPTCPQVAILGVEVLVLLAERCPHVSLVQSHHTWGMKAPPCVAIVA